VGTSGETDVARRMEQAIHRYFAACNTGDVEAVAAFFTPGTGLITEIRLYLAAPPTAGASRVELEEFPYAERGYTMNSWLS